MNRISLAQVMALIALVALQLGLFQSLPPGSLVNPTIWVYSSAIDYVIISKLILRRELRALDYTFLIVLLPAFVVLWHVNSWESLRIVRTLVERVGGIKVDVRRNIRLVEAVDLGELWLDAALAVLLAWIAGRLAALLERHRGWDIAAFWRVALLGLFAAMIIFTLDDLLLSDGQPLEAPGFRIRLAIISALVIGGGFVGLLKFRSKGLSAADSSTAPPAPAG